MTVVHDGHSGIREAHAPAGQFAAVQREVAVLRAQLEGLEARHRDLPAATNAQFIDVTRRFTSVLRAAAQAAPALRTADGESVTDNAAAPSAWDERRE